MIYHPLLAADIRGALAQLLHDEAALFYTVFGGDTPVSRVQATTIRIAWTNLGAPLGSRISAILGRLDGDSGR